MATVSDILAMKGGEVVAVSPDESVAGAARLMNERGIGGLVVTEGDRMVGIFTERDILRRVVALAQNPESTSVREVMTSPVVRIKPDTRVEECVALITEKRIRHLPVTDGDTLKGIVTSGDVLAYQVQEQRDTIKYLNSYVYDLR